ncbi:MAG: type II secretion system F family protein [Proteobacteria bacterium]|nr:type II secretion system F family protein [Pseudomonadota bacterium]
MPEYDWRAVEAAGGRMTSGRLEATSQEQALRQLQQRGLVPVAVQPAGAGASAAALADAPTARRAPWWSRSRGVTRADVLAATHELAVMLRAGLPLAYALRILVEMSAKPPVQALLQQVLDDVKGGAPLSRALARQGDVFGDFYVQMVRAGEAAGQLPATLERLAEHLARSAALRESVISAATYPAILLVVALLSLVGMIGFVVPQFEKLFADMGDAVPLPTRMVLALSHHARDWGLVWIGVLLLLAVAFVAWRRTPAGQVRWQALLLRLPLLGRLLHGFQLGLFARTLGTLATSGVPLLSSLDIAVDTVSSQPVRQALRGMVMPVKSGTRLAQAMADTRQFEPLAVNLVRVGEETGRLGPLLLELARIADQRVETGLKRMLALLEPLLIVVLGVLIAGIIVSILLGILSVNEIAA